MRWFFPIPSRLYSGKTHNTPANITATPTTPPPTLLIIGATPSTSPSITSATTSPSSSALTTALCPPCSSSSSIRQTAADKRQRCMRKTLRTLSIVCSLLAIALYFVLVVLLASSSSSSSGTSGSGGTSAPCPKPRQLSSDAALTSTTTTPPSPADERLRGTTAGGAASAGNNVAIDPFNGGQLRLMLRREHYQRLEEQHQQRSERQQRQQAMMMRSTTTAAPSRVAQMPSDEETIYIDDGGRTVATMARVEQTDEASGRRSGASVASALEAGRMASIEYFDQIIADMREAKQKRPSGVAAETNQGADDGFGYDDDDDDDYDDDDGPEMAHRSERTKSNANTMDEQMVYDDDDVDELDFVDARNEDDWQGRKGKSAINTIRRLAGSNGADGTVHDETDMGSTQLTSAQASAFSGVRNKAADKKHHHTARLSNTDKDNDDDDLSVNISRKQHQRQQHHQQQLPHNRKFFAVLDPTTADDDEDLYTLSTNNERPNGAANGALDADSAVMDADVADGSGSGDFPPPAAIDARQRTLLRQHPRFQWRSRLQKSTVTQPPLLPATTQKTPQSMTKDGTRRNGPQRPATLHQPRDELDRRDAMAIGTAHRLALLTNRSRQQHQHQQQQTHKQRNRIGIAWQQQQPAADDRAEQMSAEGPVGRNNNNATTTTVGSGGGRAARRIQGNARRSEERSRQLLLCEASDGGELCRMLFKGRRYE